MRKWMTFLVASAVLLLCIGCRVNDHTQQSTDVIPSTLASFLNPSSIFTELPSSQVIVASTQTQPVSSESETIPTQTQPISAPTEPIPTQTQPIPTETQPKPTETEPVTEPVPLPEPCDEDIVRVSDYISNIFQTLRYATEDNFTGQVIYDFSEAYLRYGTVKKLALVCDKLADQGLGLLIWDAFRPVSAQQALWDICPDPTYVSHPATGNRSHCRGSAVDVTLVDLETGLPLVMPTDFDDFTALADRDYSDCSEDAARNALLLEQIMEKYGFQGYSAEWWHFSDSVSYPVDLSLILLRL